jgi:hypothetical protein
MAVSVFGRLLVSLSAIGALYAIMTQRRHPGLPRAELAGALVACAGGGLLGLTLLAAATVHAPIPPRALLFAAAIIATGALLLHRPTA